MRAALLLLLFLALAPALPAAPTGSVARFAPDFGYYGLGSKPRSVRALRGQPVVLIFADSAETKLFKKQLKLLRRGYSQFASRQAIFVAAFRKGDGPVSSNVPFVMAANGPAVAAAYGIAGNFAVAIIGTDGNLDYQTTNVVAPERMIDVMQNGFPAQTGTRKTIEQ